MRVVKNIVRREEMDMYMMILWWQMKRVLKWKRYNKMREVTMITNMMRRI